MDQRKYIAILMAIVFSYKNVLASAWLPEKGKYKYSTTLMRTSAASTLVKQVRMTSFQQIERNIIALEVQQAILLRKIAIEKTRKAGLAQNAKLSVIAIKAINNSVEKFYNPALQQIKNEIEYWKKWLYSLKAFNESKINIMEIEYGISDNISAGIKTLTKNSAFVESAYIKIPSYAKSADIFCKFKLWQDNQYIISTQPKFIINKEEGNKEELFYEHALLLGYKKEFYNFDLFISTAGEIGRCLNPVGRKKNHYAFSFSETIKLPGDFLLTSFTKFTYRNAYSFAYSRTLYNQFSIAAEVGLGHSKRQTFTLQIGYFIDKSLTRKLHEISGTMVSLCLSI